MSCIHPLIDIAEVYIQTQTCLILKVFVSRKCNILNRQIDLFTNYIKKLQFINTFVLSNICYKPVDTKYAIFISHLHYTQSLIYIFYCGLIRNNCIFFPY